MVLTDSCLAAFPLVVSQWVTDVYEMASKRPWPRLWWWMWSLFSTRLMWWCSIDVVIKF